MSFPASQARCLLLSLLTITAFSFVVSWLRPIQLANPLRDTFPKADKIYVGAADLRSAEINKLALQQVGFNQLVLGREISSGPTIVYQILLFDGRRLILAERPIRVRNFNNFELQRIKLLLAMSTGGDVAKLSRRNGVYQVGADQVLVSESRHGLLAETCITSDGIGNISQNSLINTIKKIPLSTRQRLASILGLRQPREWQCLYVAIQIPSSTKNFLDATSAWSQLRQADFTSPRSQNGR